MSALTSVVNDQLEPAAPVTVAPAWSPVKDPLAKPVILFVIASVLVYCVAAVAVVIYNVLPSLVVKLRYSVSVSVIIFCACATLEYTSVSFCTALASSASTYVLTALTAAIGIVAKVEVFTSFDDAWLNITLSADAATATESPSII